MARFSAYLNVFMVSRLVLPVMAEVADVLLVIALVVKAPVVVEPEMIALFAVKDAAPVPPLFTGRVPEVMSPAAWSWPSKDTDSQLPHDAPSVADPRIFIIGLPEVSTAKASWNGTPPEVSVQGV